MKKLITLVVALALLLGVVPMTDLENGVLAPAAWAEEVGGEDVASPVTAPTTEPAPELKFATPRSSFVPTANAVYVTKADGTAVFRATNQLNSYTTTVPRTVTAGGVAYSVTSIGAKAFQGSHAKVIKLCGNVNKINKDTFTASKVPEGMIKVDINGSAYNKKQLKLLMIQLRLAGIKAKNIHLY